MGEDDLLCLESSPSRSDLSQSTPVLPCLTRPGKEYEGPGSTPQSSLSRPLEVDTDNNDTIVTSFSINFYTDSTTTFGSDDLWTKASPAPQPPSSSLSSVGSLGVPPRPCSDQDPCPPRRSEDGRRDPQIDNMTVFSPKGIHEPKPIPLLTLLLILFTYLLTY